MVGVAAIERGAQILALATGEMQNASATVIRVDETAAGLLEPRFVISRDGRGFILTAAQDTVEVERTLQGKSVPFVGRDREMATLRSIFEECVGEPVARVVLVTSPPGGGKSGLRAELVRELSAREPPIEIWQSF
jgi:hypothetical protein